VIALDSHYRETLAGRTRVKIVCVGLNYVDHAAEAKMALPVQPLLFAKWPSAVVGSGASIVLPEGVDQVDYEGELAVVIGRRVRRVAAADALDVVAGFTCLNDVSARGIQLGDGQWTRGKSFDSFCPLGPRIVPREAITDPQSLGIRTRLNGNVVQDATTADMIFSIAEIIEFVSRAITLEPGDIVATGTPPGVALGQDVPRWLEAGDVVEVEIEGIGVLSNPVVEEKGPGT
jgi:2-keto-4-pentenoate hydratase/2-oxohepta-3-ene-1,7-dioic acid hydratase in catechol pathway